MAGVPAKADINAIFKRLRSIPPNKQCFDCGAQNPTWASVTYGVFLCIDCSAVHRSLGVHLTFIRSTNLDTNWTWLQLRAMQVGGNANATAFFRQHGCSSTDAQQKYHSRAAAMYREKLSGLANKALKTYGTKEKLHIDSHTDPSSPDAHKEVDFFKDHTSFSSGDSPNWESSLSSGQALSQPVAVPVSNGTLAHKNNADADPTEGPSVEAALSMSPTQAAAIAEPRKSTIGTRKPASAKKGLGAKKGGFGAQKVKKDFKQIEAELEQKEREQKMMEENLAVQQARTKEEEEKKMASMRLAYQDLSVQQKKQDEKMKNMDPKKREQMERLGMGFGGARGVSHSAISDMHTIEQKDIPVQTSNLNRYGGKNRDFEDDFEMLGGFSSGPPNEEEEKTEEEERYHDSPFGLKKEDRYSNWSDSKSSSNWDSDRFDSKQSSSHIEDIPTHNKDEDRGRSRKSYDVSDSSDAQKKFGNAKAISSDAYFGGKDMDFETKQNLSKFEGQASISSADLFGGGGPSNRSSSSTSYDAGPDISEIREGVRQGVSKVAGKLSSLANGVITSIQDNYG